MRTVRARRRPGRVQSELPRLGCLMRWTVHGERVIYDSEWVRLALVDVEVPGGARFDHHVVRAPRQAAGVVVHEPDKGVLLLWRHRFITDTWGWEVPAGAVEGDEAIEAAAVREVMEETGWQPAGLVPLISYHPSNGLSDHQFNLFLATSARHVGEVKDASESERVEWVPVAEVRRLVEQGVVTDGLTLTALTYAFAFGHL